MGVPELCTGQSGCQKSRDGSGGGEGGEEGQGGYGGGGGGRLKNSKWAATWEESRVGQMATGGTAVKINAKVTDKSTFTRVEF